MSTTLARRSFLAHLELSYSVGRKVRLAEVGGLVARQLGREAPFSAAAVSRWEAGTQIPSTEVIEAIAAVTGTDPGWISHGDRSAAPPPARLTPPSGVLTPLPDPTLQRGELLPEVDPGRRPATPAKEQPRRRK